MSDTGNHRIRKITSAGVVSTLAGSSQGQGSADGTGTSAQFYFPFGITLDSAQNVYVADSYNNKIRKITPAGVVSTFAGSIGGVGGYVDGIGTAAKFDGPSGITIDSAGNLYVTDNNSNKIRKITSAAVVSTFAGSSQGYADGSRATSQFARPNGITLGMSGILYGIF